MLLNSRCALLPNKNLKASPLLLSHLKSSHLIVPLARKLTTTAHTMADSKPFMQAVASRRTYYALSPSSPIPDSRIQELVTETIKNTPSAFNSQTARLVLLLKKEHEKLWDIVAEVYQQQLPAEKFAHAKVKFDGFRKGYGTVRPQNCSSRKIEMASLTTGYTRSYSTRTQTGFANIRRSSRRMRTSSLNVRLFSIPSFSAYSY